MYVYIALVVIVISSKDNSNVVTKQIYAIICMGVVVCVSVIEVSYLIGSSLQKTRQLIQLMIHVGMHLEIC